MSLRYRRFFESYVSCDSSKLCACMLIAWCILSATCFGASSLCLSSWESSPCTLSRLLVRFGGSELQGGRQNHKTCSPNSNIDDQTQKTISVTRRMHYASDVAMSASNEFFKVNRTIFAGIKHFKPNHWAVSHINGMVFSVNQ